MKPFIGCDWGTSGFRLALVKESEEGFPTVSSLTPKNAELWPGGIAESFHEWKSSGNPDREAWYLEKISTAIRSVVSNETALLPVVLSGMASSSIGIRELTYATMPFPLDGSTAYAEAFTDRDGRKLFLISGIRNDRDVMRGEETQVMGLASGLSAEYFTDTLLILPGTHSKHITVRDGQLTDVQTFMTGELFALLSGHSVLQHSLASEAPPIRQVEDIFKSGLHEGNSGNLYRHLFGIRAGHLLGKGNAAERTGFLIGLLIGTELSALKDFKGGLLLCCGSRQWEYYHAALHHMKLGDFQSIDPTTMDEAAFLGQARWWASRFN